MLSERPPAQRRRFLAPLVWLAIVVVAGLIAFVVSLRVAQVNRSSVVAVGLPSASPPSPTPVPLADVARAVLARVVTIEAVRSNDEELGTGWLFDDHGDFVTNAHVIDGQLAIRIRDRHNHSHVGKVMGMDPVSDIAVIRSADGFGGPGLPLDSDGIDPVPSAVMTIGSGKATGQQEMTPETLTRVGQDVPIDSTDVQPGSGTPNTYHDMLELDGARIYQGNSGGPVLDQAGKVIGIVTLASKSQAQAFAIPIARVFAELSGFATKP